MRTLLFSTWALCLLGMTAAADEPITNLRITKPPEKPALVYSQENRQCAYTARGNLRVYAACMEQHGNHVEIITANRPPIAGRVPANPSVGATQPDMTVTSPQAKAAFDQVHTKWQAQIDLVRVANAARTAKNYPEQVRLLREIDAEPEVDVAFADLPIPTKHPSYAPTPENLMANRIIEYADNLAWARAWIGSYYERGGDSIPPNYAEAARWYQKALDTKTIEKSLEQGNAERRLALLYAYGEGVPQDQAKARQTWSKYAASDGNSAMLLRLLDHNALPKTLNEEEIQAAIAKAHADDNAAQAAKAAEQKRIAAANEHRATEEQRRASAMIAAAKAKGQRYLCLNTDGPQNTITVYSGGENNVVLDTNHIGCTATYVDGFVGPTMTKESCPLLGMTDHGPDSLAHAMLTLIVHQHVKIAGSRVTFGITYTNKETGQVEEDVDQLDTSQGSVTHSKSAGIGQCHSAPHL
jgi:TPR repeat protein